MSDLNKLEQQRKDAKKAVDFRDTVLRLAENPDFRAVIREEFMVRDCARFVRESINPNIDATGRADALGFAQAAGYLKNWLNVAIQKGDVAAGQITQIDEALDEIRAEGGE
jgi:hypothetical protein